MSNQRGDRILYERVLDESLDRMKAGESAEVIAARYPEIEQELRSELQTVQLLLAFFQAEGAPPELLRYSAKRKLKQVPRFGHA